MKDIVLALGSGGMKGNAHLGVLRVLEREGFNVRAVAGTSAGGLWGSLYAFGYTPDEIQSRAFRVNGSIVLSREHDDSAAWLGLRGVRTILEDALGDAYFEDLRMPFAVTGVDLNTAEEIIIRRGKVVDAVLATIAVPGVFPPSEIDRHQLIDGGILDPVPVGVARGLCPGLPVAAVVLSPALDAWDETRRPRLMNELPVLLRYMSSFRFSRALNLLLQAVDISGALLTELMLQADPPDVIIRPDVRETGLLDFSDMQRVVSEGERAAESALPELERAVSRIGRLRRMLAPPRRVQPPFHSRLLR